MNQAINPKRKLDSAEKVTTEDDGVAIPERVGDEPLFKVFVLGSRGAGKTVLLSSLYKQLSVQKNSRWNYYLETISPEQGAFLLRIYDRIYRTNVDWPPGTLGKTEVQFRCRHSTGKADVGSISLFRFAYHDYPGSFVSEGDEEGFLR